MITDNRVFDIIGLYRGKSTYAYVESDSGVKLHLDLFKPTTDWASAFLAVQLFSEKNGGCWCWQMTNLISGLTPGVQMPYSRLIEFDLWHRDLSPNKWFFGVSWPDDFGPGCICQAIVSAHEALENGEVKLVRRDVPLVQGETDAPDRTRPRNTQVVEENP